jgi:hypothetical protein
VFFAITDGTGGTLSAGPWTTNASGVATATLSSTNAATLTVTGYLGADNTGISVGTASVGFVAGAASQLSITTQPSATGASGSAFAEQPAIQLRDASNNVVSQAGVAVTAAIASGGGTLGGTLTATTNASGVATFTDLAITGTAGDRTLQFTAPGLTPVTSGTIAITAGSAAQIVIQAGNNQTATVGSAVSLAPSVIVRDANENPVSGVSVTFAVATGGGSVTGAVSTTNASGVATLGSWTLGNTAGENTLTATITGSDPAVSTTFTATGELDPTLATALNTAVAAAGALTQTDYTAGTWTTLQTALALPATTNAEVVAKTAAINAALAALEFAGQAALNTAVAAAGALTQTDYTAGTWTTLQTALALPATTNAEIVAKTAAINAAISGLVPIKNVSVLTIDPIAAQTFTGAPITPTLVVRDGATTLTLNTDFSVTFAGNVNAGTATVTLTGMGSYEGTRTVTFVIEPAVLTVMPTPDQSKVFGAADPVLTYTVTPTPIVGLTGLLGREVGEAVGSYAFVLGSLSAGPNYTLVLDTNAPRFEVVSGVTLAPSAFEGEAGDASVTLRWTAPQSDGGAPVTGYVVEYRVNGGDWVRVGPFAGTATEITGLQNERVYQFRVAAVNANGTGAFSSPDLGLTPRAPVPDQTGALPAPNPGEAVETVNGESGPMVIEVVDSIRVRVSSEAFELSIQVSDSEGQTVGVSPDNMILRLQEDGRIRVAGSGMEPGTVVSVWLFSNPVLAGQLMVNANGDFGGELPVPPGLGLGQHTIQVTGIDRRSVRRSASIGVILEGPEDLRVSVASSVAQPRIGDEITLEVTVTNAGRSAELGVMVNQVLNDARLRILEATPDKGTVNLERKEWTIGRLESGETVRLTLRALVILPDEEEARDER